MFQNEYGLVSGLCGFSGQAREEERKARFSRRVIGQPDYQLDANSRDDLEKKQ